MDWSVRRLWLEQRIGEPRPRQLGTIESCFLSSLRSLALSLAGSNSRLRIVRHCIPTWRQLAVPTGGKVTVCNCVRGAVCSENTGSISSRPDFSRIHLGLLANSMNADAYWRCRGCRGTTCRAPTAAPRTRSFINSHAPNLRSVPFACKKGEQAGYQ